MVAAHLAQGGLLAYPTETVYGLGSRVVARDLAALAALTDRPRNKPFLALMAGKKMVRDSSLVFTAAAERLASSFWPGPLTLVLAGGESMFPDELRGEQGGIAVRWSSHTETNRLIEFLEMPISSTSANVSGREPLQDAAGILAEFAGPVDAGNLLVLDGGRLATVSSSTLVDCTSSQPTVLREGAVSWRQIMECLEEVGE
ncbi:L-threonylcarbamoyladenylate synthase [Gemmatimonadota bacterium]